MQIATMTVHDKLLLTQRRTYLCHAVTLLAQHQLEMIVDLIPHMHVVVAYITQLLAYR